MRILIITSGFFPGKNYGGPPVSVDNFCSLMKGYAECYVVTHNHDMGEKQMYSNIHKGWNDRGNVKVLYLSDEEYNSNTFERVIRELCPEYIYLQSLFQDCVFPCLRLAQKYGIKVVLAPRGELCAGAFKKKYKKLPYIVVLRLFGLLKGVSFQSTSEEETESIIHYLGGSEDSVYYLTNIPSIPHDLLTHAKKKSGVGHFVFISRILWKKNLLKAIILLKDIEGEVYFDIYGPKEDENYWHECEGAIRQLPSNIKVKYRGVLSHDEIHKTFNRYDAFLFPTLSENYGHVIAEAFVTGCIPIISDQTPWTDMNEANAGWALPLADEDRFIEAIQEVVNMDEDAMKEKRDAVSAYLEKKLKMEELRNKYRSVFN